jgi:hypothetical protein
MSYRSVVLRAISDPAKSIEGVACGQYRVGLASAKLPQLERDSETWIHIYLCSVELRILDRLDEHATTIVPVLVRPNLRASYLLDVPWVSEGVPVNNPGRHSPRGAIWFQAVLLD